MTRYTRRNVRMRFVTPIAVGTDPIWTLTGGGTFDEGEVFNMLLHCDENGATFSAGETISVTLRSPTVSPPGTWTVTGIGMFQNAVAALNVLVPGSAVLEGPDLQIVTLRMDLLQAATWDGDFPFVRPSINNSAEQGDFSGYWDIINVTRGAIGGASHVDFTVTDTFVAPPIGLTNFTFNTSSVIGGMDTITIPVNTPNGTALATSVIPEGGAISSIVFASGGDSDGQIELVNNLPVANDLLDFENRPYVPSNPFAWGVAAYYITLIANPGANQITKQFRIRQRVAKIRPPLPNPAINMLDGTAPNLMVYPNWNNAVQWPGTNVSVIFSPTLMGAIPSGGTALPGRMPGSLKLIRGHKKLIVGKDGGAGIREITGNNITFKDVAFRPGGGPPYGGNNLDDRDGVHSSTGSNILYENCSFSWAIDELASAWGYGPQPKHIRYSRCFFHSPLVGGGHSKGNHIFGPITSQGAWDIVYDKCVFAGLNQRNPMFSNGRSHLVQNCIVMHYLGYSQGGGMSIQSNDSGGGGSSFPLLRTANVEDTTIFRANFFMDLVPNGPPTPARRNPDFGDRANAITIGNGSAGGLFDFKVYVPEGTDHDNHFFTWTGANTFNLNPDPLNRTDNVNFYWQSEEGCLSSYAPFETDMDDELMKTGTLALNTATFWDIMDNVGVRYDGAGNSDPGLAGMTYVDYERLNYFMQTGLWFYERGDFPNGFAAGPVPSNATYDFAKALLLPPGARAWPGGEVYSVMTALGSMIATEDQARVVSLGDVSVTMEPG